MGLGHRHPRPPWASPPPGRSSNGAASAGRARQELRGVCHRAGLVVRPAGNGALVVVDSRGRLTLPVWLRGLDDRVLLIGSANGSAMVVIAPVAILAGFGDLLAGGAK